VTDSQGRTVSFKNTIIILTSNLGSSAAPDLGVLLGDAGAAAGAAGFSRETVMSAVRRHFRPEFVNRIDEFIIFEGLNRAQIKAIVRLQVREHVCVPSLPPSVASK
jgi:ATP-dependent Clp protease ATP-binding subunit ClpB